MADEVGRVDWNDDRPDPLSEQTESDGHPPENPNLAPTVECSTCGQEWELSYELDELHAGNRAVEQFALDHYRHTGHYPDDVSPWRVTCQDCPAEEQYLEERPARRFGRTHARHTRHDLVLGRPNGDEHHIEPDDTIGDHEENHQDAQ